MEVHHALGKETGVYGQANASDESQQPAQGRRPERDSRGPTGPPGGIPCSITHRSTVRSGPPRRPTKFSGSAITAPSFTSTTPQTMGQRPKLRVLSLRLIHRSNY